MGIKFNQKKEVHILSFDLRLLTRIINAKLGAPDTLRTNLGNATRAKHEEGSKSERYFA